MLSDEAMDAGARVVPAGILDMLRRQPPHPVCANDCWVCHSPYSPPRTLNTLNPDFIAQVGQHGTGLYHDALVAARVIGSYTALDSL